MINAVRASSYVRPHKHEAPDKTEVFIALQGSAIVCTFDERGVLRESLRFGEAQATRGVEIPARIWHSLIALEEETVLYEIIEGPFDDRTHKRYAPWAPEENSAESEAYFRALREKLGI